MSKLIGILAPFFSKEYFEADFILRLRQSKRELTISCFHELIRNDFSFTKLNSKTEYLDTLIPAAGYYLTSVLRQKGYDTILSRKTDDETIKHFSEKDPFALCISSTMIERKQILKKIITRIREYMPETLIIIGGIFIWKSFINLQHHDPAEEFNNHIRWGVFPCNKKEIDADIFIVENHGIPTLFEVLEEREKGSKAEFTHIPNIALPDKQGNFCFTARKPEAIDFIDAYPQWNLLDTLPAWIPIRTSTGCAYRCSYCSFCYLSPKVYLRTTESILNELKLLKDIFRQRNTLSTFHFMDDNVFFNNRRTEEICNTIIKSRVNAYWAGFIRASSVNESNISLIQRSRLMLAFIGVESGDNSQLKRMKKMQSTEKMKRGIELLDRAKMSAVLTFLVGFPGETEETINNTADFINNLDLAEALMHYQLFPFYVAPLSDISRSENRVRWNLKGIFSSWSHNTMHSGIVHEKCYTLFKKIKSLPYNYFDKSFIDIFRYSSNNRKRFFELRNHLTIQLIEKSPWDEIRQSLNQMALVLNLPAVCPDRDSREEFYINFYRD